jgi:predicted nucleic acid-binding protein
MRMDGAEFLGEVRTAPIYRIYSIGDVHPGMFEVESGGISVPGEIYRLPDDVWARVEAGEPPNLYKGPVVLDDGGVMHGILCPWESAEGVHRDISEFGGWRQYYASKQMVISVITASELLVGVLRAQPSNRGSQREAFVSQLLAEIPIVAIDLAVASVHAGLSAEMTSRGNAIGAHDLLIGATAIAHNVGIVTENLRDFERIPGLQVFRSEW